MHGKDAADCQDRLIDARTMRTLLQFENLDGEEYFERILAQANIVLRARRCRRPKFPAGAVKQFELMLAATIADAVHLIPSLRRRPRPDRARP